MNVSVEISMYPLDTDYLPPIRAFIDRLNARPGLTVRTNTMSTQVFGAYEVVMAALAEELQVAHHRTPKAAFVMKVLAGDLRPDDD